MRVKIVYEAPEAEAMTCCQEVNFCGTVTPTVTVTYGGNGSEFFDEEEKDW